MTIAAQSIRSMTSRLLAWALQGAVAGVRVLVPLVGFVLVFRFLSWADWDLGWARALGMSAAALILAASWRWPAPAARWATPWLGIAATVAVVCAALAMSEVRHTPYRPADIGWTTDSALHAQDHDRPIYATYIDPQREIPRDRAHFFYGYKYGPLMLAYYTPFLRALDLPDGLYVGNAVLLALTAALTALLAWRAAGRDAALASIVLVLFPDLQSLQAGGSGIALSDFLRHELFWVGANDLVPGVLALAALIAATWRQGFLAGLALGLSLSAKLLPGALLILFLPGTVSLLPLSAGLALGLVPYLPHLLATPNELFDNVFLFNLLRPNDSTSLAHFLPSWASPLIQLASLLAVAAVAVVYHRGRRRPFDLTMASALALAAFFAGGKLIHRNYLVAWLPLAAAATATALLRGEAAPRAATAATSTRFTFTTAPGGSP